MRSDVLAAGFAFVLLVIRLIVLSLQGMMSQANFVACAGVAFCFWGAMRPSTNVIADLGCIRPWHHSHLVKDKRDENPNYYAFILIISWIAALALAGFMFSIDMSGMEWAQVHNVSLGSIYSFQAGTKRIGLFAAGTERTR